jgi:hypothetical protein
MGPGPDKLAHLFRRGQCAEGKVLTIFLFPDIFRKWSKIMPKAKATALTRFRRRLKQKGNVRVEVQVRREDAELVRGVARALADPLRRDETRMLLRRRISEPRPLSLKALLAAAPLDGVDLDRSRDTGREIDL